MGLISKDNSNNIENLLVTGIPGTGMSIYFSDLVLKEEKISIVFDPYGSISDRILHEKEDLSEVAYVDVGNAEFPVGLNIFELENEDSKTEICDFIINLMYDLYDPKRTGIIGPRFDHAIRNAILTIFYDKQATFLELVRCLIDDSYLKKLLPKVTDPIVSNYWTKQIAQTADFHKSEVLDYIVSKFGKFVTDKKVRNIVGQSNSTIDLKRLIENKKIILFDFSSLEDNQTITIISSILLAKFFYFIKKQDGKNAMSLFFDEANFWPESSLVNLLREGRKLGVSLNITTIRISDIDENLKKELLRIENITSFRVATEDAKIIIPQFHSDITVDKLCMLPKFKACVKELEMGNPKKAKLVDFTKNIKPKEKDLGTIKKEFSKQYGKEKKEIEKEIDKRVVG